MDTGVEAIKPLDELLHYKAVLGFESECRISTRLMACQKGQELFVELLHDYDRIHFKSSDSSYDITTNVTRITDICLKYGFIPNNTLQTVRGFTLLPKDYLCPKDFETKEIVITDNSLTIHHFDGSWFSEEQKLASELFVKYRKYMPKIAAGYLSAFVSIKKVKGLKEALHQFVSWLKKNADRKE